jgi:hypothetical protein
VISGTRRTLLKREPVEASSIEPVDRGPTIQPVTDIRGSTLLASYSYKVGYETLFEWIVDLRKAHHPNVYATRRHRGGCLFRSYAGKRRRGRIFFRRGLTWHKIPERGSRGDDQGAIGTSEGRAEGFYGSPIYLTDFLDSREVVDKGGVNHTIRHSGSTPQAFEVFKITSMRLSTSGENRLCSLIGSSTSEHLVARADQLGNNGRTDKSCSTRNENTHILNSLINLFFYIQFCN